MNSCSGKEAILASEGGGSQGKRYLRPGKRGGPSASSVYEKTGAFSLRGKERALQEKVSALDGEGGKGSSIGKAGLGLEPRRSFSFFT